MSLIAGVDLGSTYTKFIAIDDDGEVVARATRPTGFNFPRAVEQVTTNALSEAGYDRGDVGYLALTGFGRYAIPDRDIAITELTSHAYAIHTLLPEVRTVLDAGGQTTKAIKVDPSGRVRSFRLNDKCAAGAGAFLEKTLRYMGLDTEHLSLLADTATDPVTVSSVCAVFAESEVINHLTEGRSVEDVSAGAVIALAGRAAQLVKRVQAEPPCALTGGLTKVSLMPEELERILGFDFMIPDDDLGIYAGALGAALLGRQRQKKQAMAVTA